MWMAARDNYYASKMKFLASQGQRQNLINQEAVMAANKEPSPLLNNTDSSSSSSTSYEENTSSRPTCSKPRSSIITSETGTIYTTSRLDTGSGFIRPKSSCDDDTRNSTVTISSEINTESYPKRERSSLIVHQASDSEEFFKTEADFSEKDINFYDENDTDAAEEMLDRWDPMVQDHQSVLNLGFTDAYQENALLVGGMTTLKDYRSIRDVPCPFSDGTGRCWKGAFCVRDHPIIDELASRSGELPTRPVFFVKDLPRQTRLKFQTMFKATVVHAVSPLEFYVLPQTSVSEEEEAPFHFEPFPKEQDSEDRDAMLGEEGLRNLTEKLTKVMERAKRKFQYDRYYMYQLVAFFMDERSDPRAGGDGRLRRVWYRGAVTVDVMLEITPSTTLPNVSVQFIDNGRRRDIPFDHVVSLPSEFTSIPPLAYKCRLFSIRPLGEDYSTCIRTKFENMVIGKIIFVEVVRGFNKDRSRRPDFAFASTPYGVELRHILRGPNLVSIPLSRMILNENGGILLNPLPQRPWAMTSASQSSLSAELALSDDYRFKLPSEITEIERKRAVRMTGRRLNSKQPPDTSVFIKIPGEMAEPGIPLPGKLKSKLPQNIFLNTSI